MHPRTKNLGWEHFRDEGKAFYRVANGTLNKPEKFNAEIVYNI